MVHVMPLPGEDQHNSLVAQEPDFGKVDLITFVTLAHRPKFPVTLRFPPACVGKRATVSVSASRPLGAETVLQQPEWRLELEAGSFVAFVPELGLFQAFTVTGEGANAVIAIL
jgi:hypothetical protein